MTVIASEARQSSALISRAFPGLPRRYAPRNDELISVSLEKHHAIH
jgi:hypothetical protein